MKCGVTTALRFARTALLAIVLLSLAVGTASCATGTGGRPDTPGAEAPADAATAKANAKLWIYTMARSYDLLMKGAGVAYKGGWVSEDQRTDIEALARTYTKSALKLQDYVDGRSPVGTFEEHYEKAYDALAVIRGYLSAARLKQRGGIDE